MTTTAEWFSGALPSPGTLKLLSRNAFFNLGEYLVVPVLQLVMVPVLLRRFGLVHLGVWSLMNTVLGLTGISSFGFGDATLRYVARAFRSGTRTTIRSCIATSTILTLFGSFVIACIAVAVLAGLHVADEIPEPVRFGVIVICTFVGKCTADVITGALRGLERYDIATTVATVGRVVALVGAIVTAGTCHTISPVLACIMLGVWLNVAILGIALIQLTRFCATWRLDFGIARELFQFGRNTWIIALSGVMFTYADRAIVAARLGLASLALYSVGLQLAQQIHSISTALFTAVFPRAAAVEHNWTRARMKQVVATVYVVNVVVACLAGVCVWIASKAFLVWWAGAEVAVQVQPFLPALIAAHVMLAMNVGSHALLLAVGESGFLAKVNVTAGVLQIAAIMVAAVGGLPMIARSRIIYGVVVSMGVLKLYRLAGDRADAGGRRSLAAV